ncbi:MAG TPA: hypothetical protein VGL81_09430 [Polyangiaceae bacterium]|jgi:hypothetical protein
MPNEALLTAVKSIVANARAGKLDEAYTGYRELFASPAFATYDAHDQRQALRLMVHAKGLPQQPSAAVVEAHRTAIAPLTDLVSKHNDPADYEMLGMCHVAVGNEAGAGAVFRAGLDLERARNAQSDLCGAFMRRISML